MNAPRLSEFIKAYDVRGLVPQQLNDAVAFAIGSAFAQVVARPDGATSIVVGHDMRERRADCEGDGVVQLLRHQAAHVVRLDEF